MSLKKRLNMNKSKILYWVIAAATVLLCLFFCVMSFRETGGTSEYEYVFFGDSIVTGAGTTNPIPKIIEEETGKKTLNASFGGTTVSLGNEGRYISNYSALTSMVRLSEFILEGNYRILDLSKAKAEFSLPANWSNTIELIKTVDWSKVRFCFIEQGVNDYLEGVCIDNPSDRYDKRTYAGALRSSVENLRKRMPEAQIVLITPLYMNYDYGKRDCTLYDYGGGVLTQYVEKELEIAEEYNLLVIDNFHDGIINRENYEMYLKDGLHCNEKGNEAVASNICRYLKEFDEFTTDGTE